MTILLDTMNYITQATLYTILFLVWAYAWVAMIKWFLIKAKMALHLLFPSAKWFQDK
ncbi:hypothetical protein [Streptococcus suis]